MPDSASNSPTGDLVLTYDTETTIRVQGAAGPIELEVETSDLSRRS